LRNKERNCGCIQHKLSFLFHSDSKSITEGKTGTCHLVRRITNRLSVLKQSVSRLCKQARSQGMQLGAVHPLQIWMHPPAICKISKTNMLISQLHKKCHILRYPRVASVKQVTFKHVVYRICMMFCAVLQSALHN